VTVMIVHREYAWCEKRSDPVAEDERGPDSVECLPGATVASHRSCLLDYSDLGLGVGFVCGCECHDAESGD